MDETTKKFEVMSGINFNIRNVDNFVGFDKNMCKRLNIVFIVSKPASVNDEEMQEVNLQEATTIKHEAVQETSAGGVFDNEWWAKHADEIEEICKPYDKE